MKKIYKYELDVEGAITTINAPIEEILTVQWQNGNGPVMWAVINTDLEDVSYDIIALGTGWEVPSGVNRYLGTVQDDFGFVWHYFIINLDTIQKRIDEVKTSFIQLKEEALANLATSLGKIGMSVEEAGTALEGLFDACI